MEFSSGSTVDRGPTLLAVVLQQFDFKHFNKIDFELNQSLCAVILEQNHFDLTNGIMHHTLLIFQQLASLLDFGQKKGQRDQNLEQRVTWTYYVE